MRSTVIAPRLRKLSRASGLLCLAAVTSKCSSGASRFDQVLTASIPQSSNQSQIIGVANRGAPTASTVRNGIVVAQRAPTVSPATATQLAPSVSKTSLPAVTQQVQYPPTAGRPAVSTGADALAALSKRTALPQAAALPSRASVPTAPQAPKGAFVLAPPVQNPNVLTTGGIDRVQTASIATAPVQTTAGVPATRGWQGTTATAVELKRGETLYNLSRRFGVPVSALMAANGIQNADAVQAGTRINIPSYSYDNTAPVSAPDQNPIVKASRASRGFQGQAVGKVATPKYRAVQDLAQRPEVLPVAPRSGAVAATSSTYTVVAGDTLYAIARKHGRSVADIQSANRMANTNVRLGQRLVIPGRVDRNTTASIPTSQTKQVTPVVTKNPTAVRTAAASSAAGFLWPAQGKILSRFGERGPQGSNDGIDISMPVGTPVKATNSGTVVYSGSELEDFGKLILVSHDNGWVSAYAHASQTLVRRGDKVARGQVIAKSGKTGNTSVPKLHFELRKNSNPQNPLSHLPR